MPGDEPGDSLGCPGLLALCPPETRVSTRADLTGPPLSIGFKEGCHGRKSFIARRDGLLPALILLRIDFVSIAHPYHMVPTKKGIARFIANTVDDASRVAARHWATPGTNHCRLHRFPGGQRFVLLDYLANGGRG